MTQALTGTLHTAMLAVACAMSGSAAAASADDWAKAEPLIKAALECKSKLKYTPEVNAVLAAAKDQYGTYNLPGEITLFGLKTKSINLYEGDEEDGRSYTAIFLTNSLPEVGKAAKLTKEKGGMRWLKLRKDGSLMFEAGAPREGQAHLNCLMPF